MDSQRTWCRYYDRVGTTPNRLVMEAASFTNGRRAALDAGGGNLRDAKYLRSIGFRHVLAVDSSREILRHAGKGVKIHIGKLEEYAPGANTLDFVCCCNTLWYLSQGDVVGFFQRAYAGLRQGGIFACHVLGEEDEWVVANSRDVSSFTSAGIDLFCSDFEILQHREFRSRPVPLSTPRKDKSKFWHIRSLIMRKN